VKRQTAGLGIWRQEEGVRKKRLTRIATLVTCNSSFPLHGPALRRTLAASQSRTQTHDQESQEEPRCDHQAIVPLTSKKILEERIVKKLV
jgi:hypothetical protein